VDSRVTAQFPQHNATTVTLWNDVLAGFEMSTVLKGNASDLIGDLLVRTLEMYPINNTHVGIRDFNITVGVINPLGKNSPIDIQRVTMRSNLLGQVNGQLLTLGQAIVSPVSITNGSNPTINISIPSAFLVFPQDSSSPLITTTAATRQDSNKGTPGWSNFAAFIEEFMNQPNVTMTLNGTTDALSDTVLGQLSLTNLRVNTSTTFAGTYPSCSIYTVIHLALIAPSTLNFRFGWLERVGDSVICAS